MQTQAELIENQVDYLTASVLFDKLESNAPVERALLLGQSLLLHEEESGNAARPFSMHSFKGVQCGQVAVAESGRGLLFRLSGKVAADRWREVYELATNVSRIDCAATVRFNYGWRDMSLVHLQEARDYAREHSPRLAVTRIDGGRKGNTLNIGSRASDAYVRIYDKERESKSEHYRLCWRYEVEFKRKAAECVAAQLSDSDGDPITPAQVVSGKLRPVVTVPYQVPQSVAPPGGFLRPSTVDSKLRWLRQGVAGSVQFLVKRGKLLDTLMALGLSSEVLASAGYIRQAQTNAGGFERCP